MNLQAPIGYLHPDPAMLVIDRALHDDLLDSDLHREIAVDAKTNDFARLEVLSVHYNTSITAPKPFTTISVLMSCLYVSDCNFNHFCFI